MVQREQARRTRTEAAVPVTTSQTNMDFPVVVLTSSAVFAIAVQLAAASPGALPATIGEASWTDLSSTTEPGVAVYVLEADATHTELGSPSIPTAALLWNVADFTGVTTEDAPLFNEALGGPEAVLRRVPRASIVPRPLDQTRSRGATRDARKKRGQRQRGTSQQRAVAGKESTKP